MADERKPKQKTPKGTEVPGPKLGYVMAAFEKIANAPDPEKVPPKREES